MFDRTWKKRIGTVLLCSFATGCAVEPQPLTPDERAERSAADLKLVRAMEFVPDGPITLHWAMARAVAFNLERRVKEIEREIEDAELRTRSFEMLPSLDLDAARDRATEQLSTTDDRITSTASAGLTWNVLDLGVSYARAKQQADEVLIAREKERKALQDIIRQVRTAFWRAAGAQRLMRRVDTIASHIKVAMRESRAMERSGANDVIKSVAYRREIVESVRQALSIQREMREAKAELGELLNIRPGADFTLATTRLSSAMPALPMSLPEMEDHALENRPELRVEDYNERMSTWQAREALFDMLPGAKLSASSNYSSDQFNLAPNWISTGFQLGMNLFDLFSGTSRMDEAEARGELARRQRLAMTLAVMTQTHMAYIQFQNAAQQMRLAREVARADRRLALLVASDTDFVNTDYFEAVRLATRQLQSEMDEHRAQVDLITAHSEAIHAVGLDVFPETVDLDNPDALTEEIRKVTAKWEAQDGELDAPSETPLDLLVNAMLQNGERATEGSGKSGPTFEVRLNQPPQEAPDEAVAALNTIPASGIAAGGSATGGSATGVMTEGEPEADPPPQPEQVAEEGSADTAEDAAAESTTGPLHVVQLGVFRSGPAALKLRRKLTGKRDAALYGVEVNIVDRPSRTGETMHYVETAAIPDRSMAIDLCTTLKGLGQDCVAVTR